MPAGFTADANAALQAMDGTLASAATDPGRPGLTGPEANAPPARLAAPSPGLAGNGEPSRIVPSVGHPLTGPARSAGGVQRSVLDAMLD